MSNAATLVNRDEELKIWLQRSLHTQPLTFLSGHLKLFSPLSSPTAILSRLVKALPAAAIVVNLCIIAPPQRGMCLCLTFQHLPEIFHVQFLVSCATVCTWPVVEGGNATTCITFPEIPASDHILKILLKTLPSEPEAENQKNVILTSTPYDLALSPSLTSLQGTMSQFRTTTVFPPNPKL